MKEISPLIHDVDSVQLRIKISSVLSLYEVTPVDFSEDEADIEEKVEMFITSKKLEGLSNNTLKEYKSKLNYFGKCVHKPVKEVTTNDIRMYLGQFANTNIPSTLDTKLSTLKSFFGWLIEEELIEKDPTRKIKPIRKEKRLRGSLSIEELELVRESCKDLKERALFEFLYATGCRLDETVNINKRDLDLNDLSAKVIGKGNKQRKVYFSAKTKVHLNKYLLSRLDTNEALFVASKQPHGRLGRRSIQKIISKLGKVSGINKNVFPHLLRHTVATLLVNNGTDIVTVQKLLGHSSPATTQVYAKANDEYVHNEYKKHLVV